MSFKKDPSIDEFQPVTFESQSITTIALLLRSTEEEVVIRALGTVLKFIEKTDRNKIEAKEKGILEVLIPHLNSNRKNIVKYTCMCCALFSSLAEIRILIRGLDVIPKLLEILSHEDQDVTIVEYATLTLSFMATDYHGRMLILKLDGVDILSRMLLINDPDVQKNSVETFSYLLQDLNAIKKLDEIGGILTLFDLFKSEFEVIQQLVFVCLNRITNRRKKQNNFVESGGLVKLLHFVDNKVQSDFQADALRILTNCLEDPDCELYLRSNNFLSIVVDLLKKADKNEMKLLTVRTLHKIAKNENNLKLMQKEELEELFVNLLSNDIPAIQSATCEVIASIAENRYWRESLQAAGVIEPLVRLLSSPDRFVCLAATIALANMTFASNKNSKEVCQHGALPILVEFLESPSFELQAATAACLTNLAIDKSVREDAIRLNVMAGFINCIKSRDLIVQLNTCTAMASYIYDSEARLQLLNLGVAPLVMLLSVPKPEIYLKALWIISTIGVYLDVAVAMCENGVIHALSQHVNWKHRGNYANLVMERILLTHLPAKYGYTGRLAVTDHIYDLFYDCGVWPWEISFRNLEEFTIEPVNTKSSILLVNFQTKPNPLKFDVSSAESDSKSESSVSSAVFRPTRDPTLLKYLDEVRTKIMPLDDIRQQAKDLAEFVSDKLGGKFSEHEILNFTTELEASRLKCKYTSNVIPIGSYTRHTFRARALLYKALADQIGIPCSLIRGHLRRIWNEVLLPPVKTKEGEMPLTEIVIPDLIFEPGRLLPLNSLPAMEYCEV